jgi:hypothetical protein
VRENGTETPLISNLRAGGREKGHGRLVHALWVKPSTSQRTHRTNGPSDASPCTRRPFGRSTRRCARTALATSRFGASAARLDATSSSGSAGTSTRPSEAILAASRSLRATRSPRSTSPSSATTAISSSRRVPAPPRTWPTRQTHEPGTAERNTRRTARRLGVRWRCRRRAVVPSIMVLAGACTLTPTVIAACGLSVALLRLRASRPLISAGAARARPVRRPALGVGDEERSGKASGRYRNARRRGAMRFVDIPAPAFRGRRTTSRRRVGTTRRILARSPIRDTRRCVMPIGQRARV